jgi:hypothetical protein
MSDSRGLRDSPADEAGIRRVSSVEGAQAVECSQLGDYVGLPPP